jgi:hypothetical protein
MKILLAALGLSSLGAASCTTCGGGDAPRQSAPLAAPTAATVASSPSTSAPARASSASVSALAAGSAAPRSACDVAIERGLPTVRAANWVALWKALVGQSEDPPEILASLVAGNPGDDLKARDALGVMTCSPACGIAWPPIGGSSGFVVVPAADGKLVAYGPLATGGSGQCDSAAAEVEIITPRPLRARVTVDLSSSRRVCFDEDGAWTDHDEATPGVTCQSACTHRSWEEVEFFLRGSDSAAITQQSEDRDGDPTAIAKLDVEGDAVVVRAKGCTRKLPLWVPAVVAPP